jgi:hypothetical protein
MPVAEGPGEGGASEPARFWPSRAVAPPTGKKIKEKGTLAAQVSGKQKGCDLRVCVSQAHTK